MTSDTDDREDPTPKRPADDPYAKPDDADAYIGSRPEREVETIPGGIESDDERIAAHSTQTKPVHDDSDAPADAREAGQSR